MFSKLCVVLGLLLGCGTYLAADPLYSVTEVGSFGSSALNNAGQVVGYDAFYSNGQLTTLSALTGMSGLVGASINNAGQITGFYSGPGPCCDVPFLYSNGQVQTFGSSVYGKGLAINDLGQVAGWTGSLLSQAGNHAFLYSGGQLKDLGTLGAVFDSSYAYGINNAGQVIGVSKTASGFYHAFLYSNGHMTDLGNLGKGLQVSTASAINNIGQITGSSDGRAFLYANGQMQELGTITGSVYETNEGLGINDAGQIVGDAAGPYNFQHAFLYSGGQMLDLNNLIDPALHLTLIEATGINDQGQILAISNDPYPINPHTYLLTPVPEPGTWALLGLALVLGACWHLNKPV